MAFRGLEFDLSVATLTQYDDGFLGVQIKDYGDEDQAGGVPFELHSPFGFLSRPDDPDSSGLGCQVLYSATGNDTHAWLSHDPRYIPLLPQLKKGGSMQYCKKGAFAQFDGDDGSYTIYIPYANGAKAMALSIDVVNEAISLVHGDGMALVLANGTATLKNADGSAVLFLDAGGVNFGGNITLAGGVVAGSVASAQPVALAPPILAWITAAQAFITAAAAQLSAPGPVSGVPTQTALASAAQSAAASAASLGLAKAMSAA